MWSRFRFRRRTFAPNRPAIWPDQYPLVILSVVAILGGMASVIWVLSS